jgi:1-pyrroline-5-carboxylate dehydrogenase
VTYRALSEDAMPMKITYATMSTDNEEMNQAYEEALESVKPRLGQKHGVIVDGEERTDRPFFVEASPIDSGLIVGRYAQATTSDVDNAVVAAKAFAPDWEAWGWERRRDLMLAAADHMESQLFELGALLSYEIGKNRLESLGDVAETVEFLRYYARQITEHNGFVTSLSSHGANDANTSVLRGAIDRGAPHREHRGDQAVESGRSDGARVPPCHDGGRPPDRGPPRRDRR